MAVLESALTPLPRVAISVALNCCSAPLLRAASAALGRRSTKVPRTLTSAAFRPAALVPRLVT